MTRLAMKKPPSPVDCISMSLFLEGAIEDPFLLATPETYAKVVQGLISRNLAARIAITNQSLLKIGDIVNVENEHAYIYLGFGLLYEHNHPDAMNISRFRVLPKGGWPDKKRELLRIVQRPDFLSTKARWRKNSPSISAVLFEMQDTMRDLWYRDTPPRAPSSKKAVRLKETYRECKAKKDTPQDLANDHLYGICFGIFSSWGNLIAEQSGKWPWM